MLSPDDKECPFCGEVIKAKAVKCRFCGEFLDNAKRPGAALPALTGDPAPGAAAAAVSGVTPAPAEPQRPQDIYVGGPSKWCLAGPWFQVFVLTALALGIVIFGRSHVAGPEWSAKAKTAVWIAAAAVDATAWLCFFWQWLLFKSRIYRITSERIEYEKGIFSKTVRNLDLWRVQDFGFQQNLLQRLLGIGVITVVSSDASDPRLTVGPIARPRIVYDVLKAAHREADSRRNVMHLQS